MITEDPTGSAKTWGQFWAHPTFPATNISFFNKLFNVTWPVNGTNDLTPTVTWTGGPLDPERGFHALEMLYSSGSTTPAFRSWTAFLPYNIKSFTFPEVPSSLAGWGFVAGTSHNLYLSATFISNFDFDNGDFASWLYHLKQGSLARISKTYIP